MKTIFACLSAFLVVLLLAAYECHAAPVVTVSPATSNSYSVSVANVKDTAAIDFQFTYDTTVFSSPVVADGPFAVAAKAQRIDNLATPGVVRVVYFMVNGGFSGNGQLATVSFTRLKASDKGVQDVTTEMYSTTSSQIATQTILDKTTGDTSQTPQTGVDSVTNKGNTTTTPNTSMASPGTVTTTAGGITVTGQPSVSDPFPGKPGATQESRRDDVNRDYQQPAQTPAATTPEAASSETAAVKESKQQDKKPVSPLDGLKTVAGILTRFQEYKGGRTIKELATLFTRPEDKEPVLLQKPAIAVSDGASRIVIRVKVAADNVTPSFSLRGANLKGIKTLSGGVWELEALPQKAKWDVRLSVMLPGDAVEVPLTVVPPLDNAVPREKLAAMSESAVNALLAKTGEKGGKPAYDLNGDGVQDAIDDYILTAHWLLTRKPAAKGADNAPPAKKP